MLWGGSASRYAKFQTPQIVSGLWCLFFPIPVFSCPGSVLSDPAIQKGHLLRRVEPALADVPDCQPSSAKLCKGHDRFKCSQVTPLPYRITARARLPRPLGRRSPGRILAVCGSMLFHGAQPRMDHTRSSTVQKIWPGRRSFSFRGKLLSKASTSESST